MRGKFASEHNFSGVGRNFRVFKGIFPGANKIQGFSGSSRVSRVCWPPWKGVRGIQVLKQNFILAFILQFTPFMLDYYVYDVYKLYVHF